MFLFTSSLLKKFHIQSCLDKQVLQGIKLAIFESTKQDKQIDME